MKNPLSIVPNFEDHVLIDKDGKLSPEWKVILTQLFQQLGKYISNEGLKVPDQPTDNILKLNTAKSVGNIIYDSTTNEFKACVPDGDHGIYKVIQLS